MYYNVYNNYLDISYMGLWCKGSEGTWGVDSNLFKAAAYDNVLSTGKLGHVNTLRPRQNGRNFPDDIFKWIFLNENVWISINISLKFVPRGPINNIPSLV